MDCTIKVLLAPAAATFVSLLALAHPAVAVDGVIEINHAKALAGGVTASDTPGYPVTIDRAGSYRLTGNLTVPNENTSGITVSANDVGIDLNNFAIIGPVTCSGSPLTCSHASGTGSGVEMASPNVRGTSVKNGSITGMGSHGVFLQHHSEVMQLRVSWNEGGGITAANGSTISGNTLYQNGGSGIQASSGLTISGNTVYDNGSYGIHTLTGATVSGNTVSRNDDVGILVFPGSTVSGNTVYSNLGHGIKASQGSTVSGNTVFSNGDHGISATSGVTVSGNSARGNAGFGLDLGVDAGYRDNVISNNTGGTVNGGVEFGQNVCNGNTTCP